MITYKDWFIFLVNALLLLADSSFAITFELNKPTIQIGETTTLKINIPHEEDGSSPQIFEDLLTDNPNIKLLERRTSRNNGAFEVTYELTSHKAGQYQIPPVQILWGPNTFSTSALSLSVFTTRSEGDSEIRPEFERISIPFSWRKFLSGLYWIMAFLIGVWVAYWIIKNIPWRNLRHLSWDIKLPNLESDRKWLRREVVRFRKQLESGQASPQMIDEITYCLKVFLTRQTQQPATALTSHEVKHRLNPKYQSNDILYRSDSFKFRPTKEENPSSVAEFLLKKIEEEFL
jgi:hypothetical protein